MKIAVFSGTDKSLVLAIIGAAFTIVLAAIILACE